MADTENALPETKLNVVGMIGLIVFYLIIFLAGILSHKYVIFYFIMDAWRDR